MRFASRRAAKTNGAVHILALVEQADFVAWGGVQATMEEEARVRAEELVTAAAGSIFEELGQRPAITVKAGDAVDVVKDMLADHPEIAALVLGAAAASGRAGSADRALYRNQRRDFALSGDGHSGLA